MEALVVRQQRPEWRRALYRFGKNPLSVVGVGILAGLFLMAVFAPFIAPYPGDATGATNFGNRFKPPSWDHVFGTDDAGRDVLSRVIFGARIDIVAAVFGQSIVVLIGLPIGMIAGYMGGKVEAALMSMSDVFITVPPIILALTAASMFKPGIEIAMVAVAMAWWPWLARVIDGVVLHIREEKFVEASRMVGKGPIKIVFQDIFPNLISILAVKSTLDLSFVLLFISALSYLGVGAQAPTPSWGAMIGEARTHLPDVWWTSTFPGLFVFIAVLGFSLVGDGLRDSFDIKLQ